MHHVKPTSKGDPLCPLGFHPQVRWPTRCKRCFRDYKEHGNRGKDSETQLRKDELTVSTPVLSTTSPRSRLEPEIPDSTLGSRNWTSSSNLSSIGISNKNDDSITSSNRLSTSSSSWTSTPNLAETKDEVSVSITLPRRRSKPPEIELSEENESSYTRRRSKPPDTGQDDDDSRRTGYTVRRRTTPGLSSISNSVSNESKESKTTNVSIPLKPRNQQKDQPKDVKAKEVTLTVRPPIKKQSPAREVQKIQTKGKTLIVSTEDTSSDDDSSMMSSYSVIRKPDNFSTQSTYNQEYKAEIEQLKKELEAMKVRCEKAEREKSDILLRRLDSATSRSSSSEALKLQQKVNELRNTVEDLQVDKKSLTQKVRDLQYDIDASRGAVVKRENDALKEKLKAAEQLCEELMEENNEIKKEIKEIEDEMDEMHDKFREDRADEYTLLKKELDQTTKNCRILSFKLRKAERKAEQLEIEKFEAEQKCREVAGGQPGLDKAERIKQLEHELTVANETASRLQKELEEQKLKNSEKDKNSTAVKKKPPKLGSLPKTPSGEKVSRESLTRGDSQEDPVQLLRDLQDSLEREADLREQLRFAEEEILRLQMKKRLNKLTPDLIPEKLLTKICELDTKELQQLKKITEEIKLQDFLKCRKEHLDEAQQTISFSLIEQSNQTESSSASYKKYENRDTQTLSVTKLGKCEQKYIDETVLKEQNVEEPKKGTDISVQCLLIEANEKESKEIEHSSFDRSPIFGSLNCALSHSQSMPEMLQKLTFEATTQTDLQIMNPFLKTNVMPLGMILPYAPIMSPLAALLVPLARRHSPSQQRLTPEPVEKDEGISDEDDPSELRILLELNEQEAAVLRRKVEDLDSEGNLLKRKVKELQNKLSTKIVEAGKEKRSQIQQAEPKKTNAVYEQKMKVLEEEMSELRKKLIEKERECERLHAEISVGNKKPKTLQKSKSLDTDQQTVDLKRQLQVIETEASILRTKIQTLETENEKLQKENSKLSLLASKRSGSLERANDSKSTITVLERQLEESNKKIKELEDKVEKKAPGTTSSVAEVEKLKTQLKKAEVEKKKHEETLQRLRESVLPDVVEFYKSRNPKKPTDLTTKLQLKKMVEDLENEIGDILVVLKKTEESRRELSASNKSNKEELFNKEELKETKEKFERLIQEAKEECKKKDLELERLNKMIENLESDKIKVMRERDNSKTKFEKEIEKLMESKTDLEKQKKDALQQIEKLQSDLRKSSGLQEELEVFKKQIDSLKKELSEEKKNSNNLKAKLESSDKAASENTKLMKEVADAKKKNGELEFKLAEVEEKLKKSEKLANAKKDKVVKMEKEYTELNKKYTALEKDLESMTISKHGIARKLEESEERISQLKTELESKMSEIKKLEDTAKVREKSKSNLSSDSQLQEELNLVNTKLKDANEKLEYVQQQLNEKEEEMAKIEKELKKQIEEWELKASDLEMDLQANRKMMERLKTTQEREIKAKDIELSQLRQSVLSSGQKKMTEVKQELENKIDALEIALESEKHEYEDLTRRYEELEEEHVLMKATLVKEKEKVQSQLVKAANELEDVENEMRSFKETYNMKQEYWIKEKNKLEEKVKDYDTLNLEKMRLQAFCDEKQSEIDQLKKQEECYGEQIDYLKKDNDDLKSKLDDYENLDRVHRNVSGASSALETELKEYKSRLAAEEKLRKKEISSLRMKYENRLTLISEEILTMQTQMTRFKKERDSYKHLLEAARNNIAELKSAGHSLSRGSAAESELRNQVAALERQMGMLEDDLSEARIEASKLRTELNTERHNWEIRVSELTSKLNEMEEDKILNSGRTRVSGTKTRMELAWQKEREEQHRLLHETSTLARDLRQTLFEVERERDRERLDFKRKLDQLKKTNEEEQEEIRKKLNEMQCDLLELRDAHAKLRTTNEKLRREKDRFERDRDLLKQSINIKKKIEQEEERQIISVAQLVEELTVLAPDLFPSKPRPPVTMPTPPVRRKGPKSREASPALERKDYSRESSVGKDDAKSHEVQEILKRLTEAASELKKVQQEDRVSFRKAFGSLRSSSVESDGGVEVSSKVKKRGLQRRPSLLRKSISLEQTTGQEQQVWTDNDKEGSVSSIQSLEDSDRIRQAHLLRDMSLDSRLSGGSTQSEITPSDKKKKLGLFGKLKKLTKSRSIDQDSDMESSQLDPGSDSSLNIVDDRSSKPFKSKLSGMFRKSGSTSRGNSMERNLKASTPVSDSTQRPLLSSGASAGDSSKPLAKKPPATAPVQRKVFKK